MAKGLALLLLACCPLAGATTYTVNPAQSTSAIQRIITRALAGDTVSFTAGTYTITATLSLKCAVTYTGPVATPATAEITTSTANMSLTEMAGGCTSGTTTIEYLQLNGAGPLYLDGNNYSNIIFEHNQVTGLPGGESCGGPCESMFFAIGNNHAYTNITIEYNTFGDSNSCTASINIDDGGCAGINVFSQNSNYARAVNFIIRYNTFNHLNEGIHFLGTNYVVGNPTSSCNNCDIEYNYFNQIHRMAIEFQVAGVVGNPSIISNNVVGNPINPYYNTLTLSIPCCQYSTIFGNPTSVVPADYITNNIAINTLGSANSSPYGVEMMGTGTNANHNMLQGSFCNGFVWAFGAANWTVKNNTIQGAQMASGSTCPTSSSIPSGFIVSESGATYSPIMSGNVTGAAAAAITSVAPSISPASGSQSFPLTVTLTDPGYTSGAVPQGNTGIWYTTDGSTPVPGWGAARYLSSGGTFVLPAAATVKAVGMWGAANQPSRYPVGYGFVPSAVKSANYNGGVAGQQRRPR